MNHAEYDNHEKIVFVNDKESGLQAIIAVHNTQLGPALGGCRMYPYANSDAALTDVLRLSKGMSYKSAMAGLPLGGGKSVILGNPANEKTEEKMRAMAKAVDDLRGQYIVAQDSGTTVADMQLMARHTDYISGGEVVKDQQGKEVALDPSPSTALGVFAGIQSAVKFQFSGRDLQGVKIAVQGLGNVGFALAQHLHAAGATLFVQDINPDNTRRAVDEFQATELIGDQIYRHPVDVFAPCALGGVINSISVPQLNCRIVAGAANNQLAKPEHGQMLAAEDILYVPDYVLNAGGIIRIFHEREGNTLQQSDAQVQCIGDTVMELLQRTRYAADRPERIADRMASERLNNSSQSGEREVA